MLDPRGGWLQRCLSWVGRAGARLFAPRVARLMEEELHSDAYDTAGTEPECVRIEDVGADTTIFSFSSAGFLHAGGMPTYAFTGFFRRQLTPFNLVFLRDVHRTAYHLSPAGAADGLVFHEQLVRDTMARLGARRNIAIGESSGAAAAVYFGSRCGMDQIIAFSVPYPMDAWASWGARFRALFDLRTLFTEPGAYWEVLLITGFSVLARQSLKRAVGADAICNPAETYGQAEPRPQLTAYFGARCRPDRTIAQAFEGYPEATLVPVPTARHILWVPLARMGGLEARIMGTIEGRAAVPGPGATPESSDTES